MTISIDIPNGHANRVLNAMCNRYGYDPAVHGSGQQAKIDFAKGYLVRVIKEAVMADEADAAVADYPQKRKAASDKADSEIVIT